MNIDEVDTFLKSKGFSLVLYTGDHSYYQYSQEEYPHVTCCIELKYDTFQFKYTTKRMLTVQTGMCGGILNEPHFDRHLRNIVNYIANGD